MHNRPIRQQLSSDNQQARTKPCNSHVVILILLHPSGTHSSQKREVLNCLTFTRHCCSKAMNSISKFDIVAARQNLKFNGIDLHAVLSIGPGTRWSSGGYSVESWWVYLTFKNFPERNSPGLLILLQRVLFQGSHLLEILLKALYM